jgi:hypothetical protein
MKPYDNRYAVATLMCLKEIIFYISLFVNLYVCKDTNFLFGTVVRNTAGNSESLFKVCPQNKSG